jgi:hypothetical protein
VDDADQAGRSSGRLALLVRRVSLRQDSGSSSTPSGTHSASSSVATAQAEPSPAHAALSNVRDRKHVRGFALESAVRAVGPQGYLRSVALRSAARMAAAGSPRW